MNALGFVMFVAAMPVGVLGICDPNARRGLVLALGAVIAAPLGLLMSAT